MTRELRIAVTGVGGRMGAALREALRERADMRLGAAVEEEGHPIVGAMVDGVEVATSLSPALERLDAVVDFSVPKAAARYVAEAAAAGVPFVSGTTGLEAAEEAAFDRAADKAAVLWAPNMSVGVNVLFQLVADAAKLLGDGFDPEVVEMHHRFKRDAPSGTAGRIVEVLKEARGGEAVHGREGLPGPRPAEEIGVHALRGGDVVGEHTVVFAGLGERLELTHRAHSRAMFSDGALRAARFLQGKPAGRYTMRDVLESTDRP